MSESEPVPSVATRLVTQNLIVSAAPAAQPNRYVSEENVNDLATLISLCCLYDRLVLVGPDHLLDIADSELLKYLKEEAVEIRDITGTNWTRGIERAQNYASAFLQTARLPGAEEIFADIYAMSRRYGVDLEPDGPDDIYAGKQLLSDVKNTGDLREKLLTGQDRVVLSYVLRTFLYIGFSDQLRLPVAVDAARHSIVSEIADDSYRRVRETILKTLGDNIRSNTLLPRQVRHVASPFAAIVFNESQNREDIVGHLRELRREHSTLRLDLRPLESSLANATGSELEQAQARLADAIDALERKYKPKGSEHLLIRRLVAWTKPLASLLSADPSDVLEKSAESLLLKNAENTLAEIHKLKRREPGTSDQDRNIQRLFAL